MLKNIPGLIKIESSGFKTKGNKFSLIKRYIKLCKDYKPFSLYVAQLKLHYSESILKGKPEKQN